MNDSARLTPPETKGHVSVAFVPDAWYPGCRSAKLGEKPLARTLLGIPLALFRDGNGEAGAVLDRCPHRNVALSLGAVDDRGLLACSYHGWRFDRSGACREVPGLSNGAAEEAGRAVSAHAVCEQDGFVWVWGRPDSEPDGEPVRIPYVDDPDYLVIHREYLFDCTLHAALENALDVPHTAFVHKGDFRGKRERQPIEALRRRIPNGIEVEYVGESPLTGDEHDASGNPIVQRHWDRFFLPSMAQVEYKTGDHSHLVTTLPHAPIGDFQTRAFVVSCWRTPTSSEEARPGLEAYLDNILGQDVEILRLQTENIRRFGGETYRSTDLDLMGPEIWRMLRQAERGLDPNAANIDGRVELTV